MDIKVKKELKPFLLQNDKTIFDLPSKSKEYYQILVGKIKRGHTMKNTGAVYFQTDHSGLKFGLMKLKI